jgi:hypothetical protein
MPQARLLERVQGGGSGGRRSVSTPERKRPVTENGRFLVVGGVGVDTIVRVKAFPREYRDAILVPPVYDYVGHTGNGVSAAGGNKSAGSCLDEG